MDGKKQSVYYITSLIFIQTAKKQSLCLDNDGGIIETSDSISFNFFFYFSVLLGQSNHICFGFTTLFLFFIFYTNFILIKTILTILINIHTYSTD